LAAPPGWNSWAGISTAVTKLEVSSSTAMIPAAVASSRRVPEIRRASCSSAEPFPAATWGMTSTPVSNPDRPRASLGKATSATPITASALECSVVSADHQSLTLAEPVTRCTSASPTTTAFSARYTTTSTTAMPMASLNPRRNTAASAASSTSVTTNWRPCRKSGAYGFSSRCVDASAADRVIVIMKSVAAKPSSTRTTMNDPSRAF
jgi:hypothetical protein